MKGFGAKGKKTTEKVKFSKDAAKKAKGIFKYLKPHAFIFSLGLLLLVISTGVTLIFPRVMGQMAGVGSEAGQRVTQIKHFFGLEIDVNNLNTLAMLLFLVFFVQAVVSFFRIYIFAHVTEKTMLALRSDVYAHIVRMPMSFFSEKRIGDLNSRVSADIAQVQETFTVNIAEFIRQILTITAVTAFLFYYSATLTLIMLASLPVIIVVAVVFGKFIRKLSKTTQDKVSDSNVVVQETLTAIVNVKSFAKEFFEIIRYKKSIEEIKVYAMKAALWRGLFSSFIIIFVFGAISLVIWQGAVLMRNGELPTEFFFTFIMYTVLLGASFGGVANVYSSILKTIGALENIFDLMNETPEEVQVNKVERATISGAIQFENVHFSYSSRAELEVLKGISFEVKPGEQVAIVGPSGAGKSTLISMLLRFYSPIKGQILFDGKNANDFDLSALRNCMALVPQEVILFGGSILENIGYPNPDASFEEIKAAAEKANALEFIESFPEGFDTLVGERGIQLSGGQKQRIAIARAFLKNPEILILDEATSSLDSESERAVQVALDKLMEGRTSVVIAHRLSTIRNADKILVMNQGQVVETGTHDELNEAGGLYRQLSKLQFEVAAN